MEYLELIRKSLQPEHVNEVMNIILDFLNKPESIFILFQLLNHDPSLTDSIVLYLYKSIKINVFNTPKEINIQKVKDLILDNLYKSENTSVICTLSEIICLFIKLSPDGWPELPEVLFNEHNILSNKSRFVTILNKLIVYLGDEVLEVAEIILDIISEFVNCDNLEISSYACFIMSMLYKIDSDIVASLYPNIIARFLSINEDSKYIQDVQNINYIFKINQAIQLMIDSFHSENKEEICIKAIRIASNSNIDHSIRYEFVFLCSYCLELFDKQKLSNLLDLIISIGASQIECDGKPILEYEYNLIFDKILCETSESIQIYDLIKEKIDRALKGNDICSCTFCITLFRSLILNTSYIDSDTIFFSSVIEKALLSENNCLIQAALIVLNSIDNSKNFGVLISCFLRYSIEFLKSNDSDIVYESLKASNSLIDYLDTPIDGLLTYLWSLKDIFSSEHRIAYFSNYIPLLSLSLLNDTNVSDSVINELYHYALSFLHESYPIKFSFTILILVSTLILNFYSDELVQNILPSALFLFNKCIQSKDPQLMLDSIDFIMKIHPVVGSQIIAEQIVTVKSLCQNIIDYEALPQVEEEEEEEEDEFSYSYNMTDVYVLAVKCLSKIQKVHPDPSTVSFVQECILKLLSGGNLTSGNRTDVFDSAATISKILCSSDQKHLFSYLNDIIFENVDQFFISQILYPISKLLKHSADENRIFFLESSLKIIETFFSKQLPCQNTGDDYELKTNIIMLLGVVCEFANFDTIANYLYELISMINESDSSSYSCIGTLTDAINYGKCNMEIIGKTLEAIQAFLDNEPPYPEVMQNTCFLLLVILRQFPQHCQAISSFLVQIRQWFISAKRDPSGKQLFISNAAALFLRYFILSSHYDEEIMSLVLSSLPPYDTKETSYIYSDLLEFLSVHRNHNSNTLANVALALSSLLVLPQHKLIKRRVNTELYENIKTTFRQLVSTDTHITTFLQNYYSDKHHNLVKIESILTS